MLCSTYCGPQPCLDFCSAALPSNELQTNLSTAHSWSAAISMMHCHRNQNADAQQN